MSALPWQSIFILGFVVGAFVTGCGLTWFYFNVKGDLDGVANGADGNTEPRVRAETNKTPENGGQER